MLYLQGLLKVHRYRASEAKCVSRLGTISHYQELKKISRGILLCLVNLQTHGHIVTVFSMKQSKIVCCGGECSDLQNAQGCRVYKMSMYYIVITILG